MFKKGIKKYIYFIIFLGLFLMGKFMPSENTKIEFNSNISIGKPFVSLGHSGGITAITFNPNSKILASAGTDKQIKFWNTDTKKELSTLTIHTEYDSSSIAFSPNGEILAFDSEGKFVGGEIEKIVQLWSMKTYKEILTIKGYGITHICSIKFSPNGKKLAFSTYENIKIWDIIEQKELESIDVKSHSALAFSPNGNILAYTDEDFIKLWNINGSQEESVLKGHNKVVSSLVFNRNGLLASASDNSIRLWDVDKMQEIFKLEVKSKICDLAFTPDGENLVFGTENGILNFLSIQNKNIKSIQISDSKTCLRNLIFNIDENVLFFTIGNNNIFMLNIKTKELEKFGGNVSLVTSIDFNKNNQKFALTSMGKVKILDFNLTKIDLINFKLNKSNYIDSILFSPNKDILMIKNNSKNILWNLKK
jgi:WD40 repeat protein